MPKKNAAGKCTGTSCCCGPVTERIDEFDSFWPCFRGQPDAYGLFGDSGSRDLLASPFSSWAVTGGQMVYSRPAVLGLPYPFDVLVIEAVRLPIPFSMEIILDVAELNVVSGDAATLMIQMNDSGSGARTINGVVTAGMVGTITPQAIRAMSGSGGGQLYTNPLTTLPAQLWYKIQVDTDGISHWLWINGVKPTTGLAWGTKQLAVTPSLNSPYKRYWSLHVREASGARANWAKFNRIEVREWDHTSITMPDPDNP